MAQENVFCQGERPVLNTETVSSYIETVQLLIDTLKIRYVSSGDILY